MSVQYLTSAQYHAQKSALTRAINSGDPARVRETVVKTVTMWNDGNYAWPDDWSRWDRALYDAGVRDFDIGNIGQA